jgi:Peptidase family M28
MSHVTTIAAEPRPVGSPGHDKARTYLIDTLASLNLEVTEQKTHFASLIAGNIVSGDVNNVIGRLRGTSAARDAVLFAAHYDSVPSGPGASDDGFGVATLLETARALASLPGLRNDVLFLFSDGEELGLLGAQAFVAEDTNRRDVRVALNFDARGTHGAVTMFDTSPNNGALIRALGEASPYPIASSFVSKLAQALPNDTDASAFKRAGIPTYSFAYADGVEHYHRFTDVAGAMDPRTIAHGGSYALPLAQHFGNSDLTKLAGDVGDVVYFDLVGRCLVTYSKLTARLFAAATLLLGAILLARARRQGLLLSGVLRAFRDAILAVVGAALLAGALQLVLAQIVPLYFSMARAKLFVPAVMLASSAFVVFLLGRRTGARARDELTHGGALLFGSILLPLAIAVPELTAPFQWPLAFALIGILISGSAERRPLISLVRFALLAPACLMMTQAAYATLVAAGATMPFVPALFAALLLVLVFPALEGVTHAGARRTALLLALASLFLGSAGVATCHYDEKEPNAGSLHYGFDTDTGKAVWFTTDTKIDARVTARIPAGSDRGPLPAFTRSDAALLSTTAPPVAREPARIEGLKSEAIDGGRFLEFAVRASADARCWELWQESPPNAPVMVDERIDGLLVQKFVRFSPELDAKLMRVATGDTSRPGWHMMHCGAGERPVALRLRLAGRGDLVLRLVELVDGLPESDHPVPGSDATLATGRAQGSDISRVSRLLRL